MLYIQKHHSEPRKKYDDIHSGMVCIIRCERGCVVLCLLPHCLGTNVNAGLWCCSSALALQKHCDMRIQWNSGGFFLSVTMEMEDGNTLYFYRWCGGMYIVHLRKIPAAPSSEQQYSTKNQKWWWMVDGAESDRGSGTGYLYVIIRELNKMRRS